MRTDALERYIGLTEKALAEKDPEKFIEILKEREGLTATLINDRARLDEVDAKYSLLLETKVLERLEGERIELLKEMEKLGKSRRASGAYSPRFPLPSMPVFLDKNG